MTIKESNLNNKFQNVNNRWMLRGIISASLSDPTSGACDPKKFTVFTDAALFTDWIKEQVRPS